ncbi:MAG: GAF domain-containing sensor histidine kinase [Bacteriovoracaceae bacterium]|nr:GAF domain-containing sensor histidine kinase [Bacteriovoracaceae bacterium]
MIKPQNHPYESDRLQSLKSYQLLDTTPEKSFDDIAKIAAQICHVPIALISLVDKERQWFKAKVGINVDETPRELSFCGHAIHLDDVMHIPDATQDKRFFDNPLVTDGPKIRFYAGAPLIGPDGLAIGTLCVIDSKPKTLSDSQLEALRALSRLAFEQFELRKTNIGLQQLLVKLESSQDQKEERLKSLGQLSSGVAHEINNPLAILKGMLEIIRLKIGDSVNLENDFKKMKNAIDRVANIVNAMKSFTQERTVLRPRNLSTQKLLNKIIDLNSLMINEAGIHIHYPKDESSFIQGDEEQLLNVFSSLIKNSIEATADSVEKWIKIETFVEDGHWVLRFSDSGRGISPEHLNRVFEPFFTTKPPGKGQGLSLSVAKGIVAAHGGQMRITQASPVIFEVKLP